MKPRSIPFMTAAILAGSVLALTACSAPATAPSAAGTGTKVGATNLSVDCPTKIIVQDSWYPQAEIGALMQLIAGDYTVDSNSKSVSGPLVAADGYTGVTLEIRAGGPAIGFQSAVSQLYSDDSITLARVEMDAAIQTSAKFPTVSVFTTLDKSPLAAMWDPATYPSVKTIKELGAALKASGGVYRYNESTAAYVQYFVGSGQLPKEVLDSSYDGTPGNFVAAGGKDAQQGYASNEPYVYEHEVEGWKKPLAYQLLADAGWDSYSTLAVRAADLKSLTPCLTKLVPVFQQGEADYFANPAKANALLLDLVDKYDTGAVYTQDVIDAADATLLSDGLVSNAGNNSVGDFDPTRVGTFFDTAVPVYTGMGTPPPAGLKATDLYTNEFIDPTIGIK